MPALWLVEAFADLKPGATNRGHRGAPRVWSAARPLGLKKSIGPVDEKQVEPNASQTVARRFRMMLAELGPTFVKLGQVLSTRGDLLPAAFIDELSVLQDDAPPVDFKLIRDQVRSAFNAELETLYAEFSPVARRRGLDGAGPPRPHSRG